MDKRINQIKWRRHNNGKYFGKFETKEEAWEIIVEFANKYRHSRPGLHTIRSLCEDYAVDGIILHETVMSRWLKDIFKITIRKDRVVDPIKKHRVLVPLDGDLYPHYMKLEPRTRKWFLNRWLRVNSGLHIPEIFVYVVERDRKRYPTPVLFYIDEEDETCKALYIGYLSHDSKKLIESLCIDGDANGLEYIKHKCEVLGFYVIGAND